MGNTFKAIQRGVKAAVAEATGIAKHRYRAAGHPVRCTICRNDLFRERKFLSRDWADPTATVLICTECDHLEWFVRAPEIV